MEFTLDLEDKKTRVTRGHEEEGYESTSEKQKGRSHVSERVMIQDLRMMFRSLHHVIKSKLNLTTNVCKR